MNKYKVDEFYNVDISEFKKIIAVGETICLSFPLTSIGRTNNPLDICHDYLQTSFCCEKIAPHINSQKGIITKGDVYYKDYNVFFTVRDIDSFLKELIYLSEMLSEEFNEYNELDVISFYDDLSEYETQLTKITFAFPRLIDSYWANMVNQGYLHIACEYYESEGQFFSKVFRKYPEQRFGFWRNAASKYHAELIYFSPINWIIPPASDISIALKEYSEVESFNLYDADITYHNGRAILLNDYVAVFFEQYEDFITSVKCTMSLEQKSEKTKTKNHVTPNNIAKDLFGQPIINKHRIKTHNNICIEEHKVSYKLSQYGDILTLTYHNYTYVFFSPSRLSFEEIKSLNDYLYPTFAKTQKIIEASVSNNCDWTLLNDDTFEELCYDILYCHPYFDSNTIQKMGKSKSRDGGRDIVIHTKRTPTHEPKKFIFQCKYYSSQSSLSASKLSNAANVIMQYGASGYGVFTTTVIDSTLYDMLDGFNKSYNINVDYCWSKYELERHLNYNSETRKKYFSMT